MSILNLLIVNLEEVRDTRTGRIETRGTLLIGRSPELEKNPAFGLAPYFYN